MTTATAGAAPMVSPDQATWFARAFGTLVTNVEQAVLGKQHIVRLALTCLVSEGHLLLEDFPGTGKTSLAKAIANSVQGTNSRIQFTPDLLPSDVTGVTIYDQHSGQFTFHGGPIFATIVVADEINRASPKTQSALLEVMEEGRVTVDGTPHSVGRPFMVIATQNPIEQAGTYRLPEAQLDRFLMKTSLGYPDHASTVALLAAAATRDRSAAVQNVVTTSAILQMSQLADTVHVDPAILGYISQLAAESRQLRHVRLGLSVRGCLAFVRTAKTWALADGRGYVVPDDIKQLAVPVLSHRLLLDAEAEFSGVTVEDVISQLMSKVPPPVNRGA
jgi:MoxR-like ATPase